MALRQLYRDAVLAVAGKSTRKAATVDILRSGTMTVDRNALHASDSFKRQLEALRKIDKKIKLK